MYNNAISVICILVYHTFL